MSGILPQIPRLARYGLASVFELAAHRETRLTTGQLAATTGAPRAMLAKVLANLHTAGIIDGVRGHHGGYRLIRDPADVTLLEVIAAATGDDNPRRVECALGSHACDANNPCALHDAWVEVVDHACEVLCGRSIQSYMTPN